MKIVRPWLHPVCYDTNDGKIEKQLSSYGVTDAYNYCTEHTCNKLTSMVRKYFSGPCMKLFPMSFIQDRRFDVRFKNGEDCLFMFLISDKIKKVSFTSKEAVYYRRYRENSAVTSHKNILSVIQNALKLIDAYCKIYINHPFRYSTKLFILRILASVKSIFF